MQDVIENDAITGKESPTGAQPGGKEETITISKAELDALRRDRDEARGSERYWANLARGNAGTAEPAAEAEEEIEIDPNEFLDTDAATGLLPDDTPEKLVDEIARDGVKALSKRGFVSAAEAQRIAVEKATEIAGKVARQIVNNERVKAVSDNVLLTNFPELKDAKSELYQETAKIYREAVAMDPNAAKSPAALFLAAKSAKQTLDAKRDPEEDEEERLLRVSAQDGRTRGRRETAADDLIGPEAESILKQMGITPEAFKEEKAKLGGARPSRRTR